MSIYSDIFVKKKTYIIFRLSGIYLYIAIINQNIAYNTNILIKYAQNNTKLFFTWKTQILYVIPIAI